MLSNPVRCKSFTTSLKPAGLPQVGDAVDSWDMQFMRTQPIKRQSGGQAVMQLLIQDRVTGYWICCLLLIAILRNMLFIWNVEAALENIGTVAFKQNSRRDTAFKYNNLQFYCQSV